MTCYASLQRRRHVPGIGLQCKAAHIAVANYRRCMKALAAEQSSA